MSKEPSPIDEQQYRAYLIEQLQTYGTEALHASVSDETYELLMQLLMRYGEATPIKNHGTLTQ